MKINSDIIIAAIIRLLIKRGICSIKDITECYDEAAFVARNNTGYPYASVHLESSEFANLIRSAEYKAPTQEPPATDDKPACPESNMLNMSVVPVIEQLTPHTVSKSVFHILSIEGDSKSKHKIFCNNDSHRLADPIFQVKLDHQNICPLCREAYEQHFSAKIIEPTGPSETTDDKTTEPIKDNLPPVLGLRLCMIWRQGDSKPIATSLPEKDAQDYALLLADHDLGVDYHVLKSFAIARHESTPDAITQIQSVMDEIRNSNIGSMGTAAIIYFLGKLEDIKETLEAASDDEV